MVALTLKCQDEKEVISQEELIVVRFRLVKDRINKFPNEREIDLAINSRELYRLLAIDELDRIEEDDEWSPLFDAFEYLHGTKELFEEVHRVFADYMYFRHDCIIIPSSDSYTIDDFRKKLVEQGFNP